ncbi:prohibitin family protein [Gemmatimonas sp.]|jgi:prohibitin 1|uniref:prohibitin family protein n=1 Tax=Gemmatimonas sp. TaxID=1962908 RepID=UPI0022C14C88|nr:prohibitin family protein [Gemmatimonas sp.]MCZ8204436.1 prohibitin family protein [Gemmatimonas sp.]
MRLFPSASRPVLGLLVALPVLTGCATIRQDEIGVKTSFGRISSGPLQPGAQFIIPGVNSVLRVPARVVNREVRLEMPSKEGLNVAAEVSILYRAKTENIRQILETSGTRYEEDVIIPVFRSSAADVSARYMAKDMHSGTRIGIEQAIRTQMMETLGPKGFVVENVLLKSIRLPADLARAIEEKLEAEQRSEQMRFVLDREKQEAERRTIEAQGIRDSWAIIAQGLTPSIISYQSIEAFRELARSPNAKVIVTDGRAPMLLTNEMNSMPTVTAPTTTMDPVAPRRIVRPTMPTTSTPRQP